MNFVNRWLAPLVVVVVLLLLPAQAIGGMGFVDLPTGVETGIASVVLFAISWIFVQLVTLWKPLQFLDQFKVPLATAITAQLIAWIEQIVPDAFGGVAVAGIVFVLAILAVFGVGQELAAQNAKGFRTRQ